MLFSYCWLPLWLTAVLPWLPKINLGLLVFNIYIFQEALSFLEDKVPRDFLLCPSQLISID